MAVPVWTSGSLPIDVQVIAPPRQEVHALRYGVGENLAGIDIIRAFRKGRVGGSPPRTLHNTSLGLLALCLYFWPWHSR